MAFFDMMLGKDDREKQLIKEVQSLELRKESVFESIDSEIIRLQRECSKVLLAAGTTSYAVWKKEGAFADLTEYWKKMQELEAQIKIQNDKKTEMGIKYDEEIRLITDTLNRGNGGGISMNSQSSYMRQPTAINQVQATDRMEKCPKCGANINIADLFCQECGYKLR